MIPKIIWQTHEYSMGDKMPKHLQDSTDFFRRHFESQGWEYKYLDKNERRRVIKENKILHGIYLDVDKVFQSLEVKDNEVYVAGMWRDYKYAKGMYRSDVLKLVVLYEFGGIYLDSDTTITKKSLDLLESTDYDLYASVHAKGCPNCFMPLRDSHKLQFQSTEIKYPNLSNYLEKEKNFYNIYGIDAIAVKPKLDIIKDTIDQILDAESIAYFQEFYTENIYRYKSASERRINEELDTIEFKRIADYFRLPDESDKYPNLRREEEITCFCQDQNQL